MIRPMAKRRVISAHRFKTECLVLLDRVARRRESFVVTRRGRPIAEVVPVPAVQAGPLAGSVSVRGDIVGPTLDEWPGEARSS
jgi:antitoxin (DNA-binding transcriptional repressor) of toxin-antitoxin stability system